MLRLTSNPSCLTKIEVDEQARLKQEEPQASLRAQKAALYETIAAFWGSGDMDVAELRKKMQQERGRLRRQQQKQESLAAAAALLSQGSAAPETSRDGFPPVAQSASAGAAGGAPVWMSKLTKQLSAPAGSPGATQRRNAAPGSDRAGDAGLPAAAAAGRKRALLQQVPDPRGSRPSKRPRRPKGPVLATTFHTKPFDQADFVEDPMAL